MNVFTRHLRARQTVEVKRIFNLFQPDTGLQQTWEASTWKPLLWWKFTTWSQREDDHETKTRWDTSCVPNHRLLRWILSISSALVHKERSHWGVCQNGGDYYKKVSAARWTQHTPITPDWWRSDWHIALNQFTNSSDRLWFFKNGQMNDLHPTELHPCIYIFLTAETLWFKALTCDSTPRRCS